MDLSMLKQFALNLREKLEDFSEDENVAELAEMLNPLLEQAIAGELLEEVDPEDIPGEELFDDGLFEDFEGLEDAYRDFAGAIGGESDDDGDYDDEDEDE